MSGSSVATERVELPPKAGHARSGLLQLIILGAGPALSIIALSVGQSEGLWPADWTGLLAGTVLVLVWSPLFCSIPALMMQDERDRILPDAPRVVRAIRLVPELLSATSPVRDLQRVSLAGFAVAGALLLLL